MPLDFDDIPIDVFEAIIDQACDLPHSLNAISLTCRTFLPRAQYHLFYRIIIRSSEQICSVPTFLRERPWLLPLVCVVRFKGDRENGRSANEVFEVISVPLLTQLPNLHRLELESDSVMKSLSFSRLTLCVLCKFSAPVRHLQFDEVGFFSINDLMRYLSAFPNLSHLACDGVTLKKAAVPLRADALSRYGFKLTHLEVSSSIALTDSITDVGSWRPACYR